MHTTYDISASNPFTSKPTANTSTSNAPHLHHNTLPSSNDGGYKDIVLAPSNRGSKRCICDNQELEADDEREGFDVDGDKKTPSIRSTKKKFRLKRRIKCRRFSSSLPSDEKTETGDESDFSSYAPTPPPDLLDRSQSIREALEKLQAIIVRWREAYNRNAPSVSDGCHLRAAELGRRDYR